MKLIRLEGKALQHWLEDAQGWPRGTCDDRAVASLSYRDHPLFKLLDRRARTHVDHDTGDEDDRAR